jgi:autotransporter-associated beta strand protein
VKLGALYLGDTTTSWFTQTLATSGTGVLVFDNTPAGTYAVLYTSAGTNNNVISANIRLDTALSVTNARALYISGNISSAAGTGLILAGTTINISNANNSSTMLGDVTLLSGAAVRFETPGSHGNTNTINLNGNVSLVFGGSNNTGTPTFNVYNPISITNSGTEVATITGQKTGGANIQANLWGLITMSNGATFKPYENNGGLDIMGGVSISGSAAIQLTNNVTITMGGTNGGFSERTAGSGLYIIGGGSSGGLEISASSSITGTVFISNKGTVTLKDAYALGNNGAPYVRLTTGAVLSIDGGSSTACRTMDLSHVDVQDAELKLAPNNNYFYGTLPTLPIYGTFSMDRQGMGGYGSGDGTNSPSGTLTFASGATLRSNASNGGAYVTAPIVLNEPGSGAATFTIDVNRGSGGFMEIKGTNAGGGLATITEASGSKTFKVTKIGNGPLNLYNPNAWGGGTDITAGGIALFHAQALGTNGTIALTGSSSYAPWLGLGVDVDLTSRLSIGRTSIISIDSTDVTNATFQAYAQFSSLAFVGVGNGITYNYDAATLTPADDTYRLGSADNVGGGGTLVLSNGVLVDNTVTGSARNLVVGLQTDGSDYYNKKSTLALAAANSYTGGTLVNYQNTLVSRASGAMSSGTVVVMNGAGLTFETNAQSHSNYLSFQGSLGHSTITFRGLSSGTFALTGPIDLAVASSARTLTITATNGSTQYVGITSAITTGGTNNITIGGNGNSLVLWNPSSISGTGNIIVGDVVWAINSASSLLGGNIRINNNTTVLLDSLSWSDFLGTRTLVTGGTGLNTYTLAGSNVKFAARGTAVVVSGLGTWTDRDFGLGSAIQAGDGSFYANAPVTMASDIVTTSTSRKITIASQGPGLVSQRDGQVVFRITGNISGSGNIRFGSNGTVSSTGYVPEVVLSGLNSWTGESNEGSTSNGYKLYVGRGGFQVGREDGKVLVRFANPQALPSGNSGNPAFLAVDVKGAPEYAAGILLTTTGGAGYTYTLPTGYKFWIGSINDGDWGRTGLLGVASDNGTAGKATLQDSTIVLGDQGQCVAGMLVREGEYILGTSNHAVTLEVSGLVAGTTVVSPTVLAASAGGRTIAKVGEGTLVLGNINAVQAGTNTDAAGQINYQVGMGLGGGIFEGALRETGVDAYNSATSNKITIKGGVLELAVADFTRSQGAGAGQISLASGVGFAAMGTDRIVNLNGDGSNFKWGSGGVTSGAMMFGSLNADSTVRFANTIELAGNGGLTVYTVGGSNANAVVDFQGPIWSSGSASLTIDAARKISGGLMTAGNVIFSGSNSYSGTTTILAGKVYYSGSLSTGENAFVVGTGVTLAGNGVIDRPVVVQGGATLAPDNVMGVGSLSLDNAILNWNLAFGGTGDSVVLASEGVLNTSGVSTFNFSGSFGAGLYNLIDYGTFSGTITNFTMNGAAPGGLNWLLKDNTDDGIIQLLIYASANEWASATGGDWNVSGNWTGGVPNAIGAEANFAGNLASADTVNLDIAPTVGAIKFDNANKYTIGGTYTLTVATSSGNASIQVDTGSHEIAAPVTLGSDLAANIAGDLLTISGPMDGPYGVTKTGAGKLEINGTATYTGTTHVVNGELSLGAAQTLGAVVIDSSALVTLTDGATQISSLEIAGGSSAPEAKLDIMSNALIIDYSGSESPLAEIEALIIKGYNGGDWAGNGITSSVLFDITAEAIGVIDNTTFLGGGLGEFAGRSIGMETVLVRKVIAGDIDMSGEVNAADYFYIDFNLDTAGGGWGAGDLDYSGETNSADYFYIDFNLGMSEGASMGTSIPEPATLVLLTLGGLAVIRRKRK